MPASTLAENLRPRPWHILVLAVVVFAIYFHVEHRYVEEQKRITLVAAEGARALAESLIALRGPVREHDGKLFAGSTPLEGDIEIVDTVKARTGFGCTIFQENLRISTNAVAKGGKGRAIGTRANEMVSRTVFQEGGEFRGVTRTIGKDWVIVYVPLRTEDGKIVGMLATYRELEDFLGELTSFRVLLGGELVLLLGLVSLLVYLSLIWMRRIEEQAATIAEQNARLDDANANLERKVAERTARLAAAMKEAQEARLSAENANKAKSAFLANMSHELRTPLNAIIGYGEMLAEEAADEGYDELIPDLKKIHAAGTHLLGLISDVLDISKIEAGRMELFVERLDLDELVSGVVSTARPLMEKNENELIVERPELLGPIEADVTKLRQILFNLLSNAAKFTKKGKIVLRITLDGDARVRFEVQDSGIGMTPEQAAKVFNPFVQADSSTTRKYGGTGLGLAITQKFCEMMGGGIEVHSVQGEGTTFTVELPTQVESQARRPDSDSQAPAEKREGPARVLAIDDAESARELVHRVLSKEGFEVHVAPDGRTGLEMARELEPDIITLDVMMPDMDGWSVLSALKSDPRLVNTPVVMLTIVDDQNLGFALGATDYLLKPVDRDRLLTVVRRFVQLESADAGRRALVVEDDASSRELAARILRDEGWEVSAAENGVVAMARVAEQTPDLILLDLMMPEMDGFEVVEQLRADPRWRHVPVVVLTAKELSADERAFLSRSVDGVLQKGAFDLDQLAEQLRTVLEQPQAKAS